MVVLPVHGAPVVRISTGAGMVFDLMIPKLMHNLYSSSYYTGFG
jgi:hypothetical protein